MTGVESFADWSVPLNALSAFVDGVRADGLASLSAVTDPLTTGTMILTVMVTGCWLKSVIQDNYSQVDMLWSIAPVVFLWNFYAASEGDLRCLLMAVLATFWGARLTYNFSRKGGYSGEEDYRWAIIRQRISPFLFQIFNATFIAPYQLFLLYAITLPGYVAYLARGTPLNEWDAVATTLFLFFLTIETIADQQQWTYQQAKKDRRARGVKPTGDFLLGFLTSGLFRYSRHPNFFSEQAIWWSLYVFSFACSGAPLNWTILGAVQLTMLFQGSTTFTEEITLGRHPQYAGYQKTTSRLMPWFPAAKGKKAN